MIIKALKKLKMKACGDPSNPFAVAERFRKRGMSIGAGTQILPNVVIGLGGGDPIVIGKNCVLTGCSILGHDASTNRFLGINKSIQIPVTIGDNCFIGHGAIILMGVSIGNDCIVGAGAVVTKDVPSGSVVAGNPAQIVCTTERLIERRRCLAAEHPEYFRDLPLGIK